MARLKYIDSFTEDEKHVFDNYKNLGYHYEGNLLNKVVSQEMFANTLNDIPMRQIERLIERMVNEVKQIKLHYAIALPKNSKLIN